MRNFRVENFIRFWKKFYRNAYTLTFLVDKLNQWRVWKLCFKRVYFKSQQGQKYPGNNPKREESNREAEGAIYDMRRVKGRGTAKKHCWKTEIETKYEMRKVKPQKEVIVNESDRKQEKVETGMMRERKRDVWRDEERKTETEGGY